jgi:hypothetical protein
MKAIFEKLGASTRTEAADVAMRRGIVSVDARCRAPAGPSNRMPQHQPCARSSRSR